MTSAARLLAFRSGIVVDASQFVATHAGETPSTRSTHLSLPQYQEWADRVMERAGVVIDGVELVALPDGTEKPLGELLYPEAESILAAPAPSVPFLLCDAGRP